MVHINLYSHSVHAYTWMQEVQEINDKKTLTYVQTWDLVAIQAIQ